METILCRPPQGRQPQSNLRPHLGPNQEVPNQKEDREKVQVGKLGLFSLPRFAARMALEEEEEQQGKQPRPVERERSRQSDPGSMGVNPGP